MIGWDNFCCFSRGSRGRGGGAGGCEHTWDSLLWYQSLALCWTVANSTVAHEHFIKGCAIVCNSAGSKAFRAAAAAAAGLSIDEVQQHCQCIVTSKSFLTTPLKLLATCPASIPLLHRGSLMNTEAQLWQVETTMQPMLTTSRG